MRGPSSARASMNTVSVGAAFAASDGLNATRPLIVVPAAVPAG